MFYAVSDIIGAIWNLVYANPVCILCVWVMVWLESSLFPLIFSISFQSTYKLIKFMVIEYLLTSCYKHVVHRVIMCTHNIAFHAKDGLNFVYKESGPQLFRNFYLLHFSFWLDVFLTCSNEVWMWHDDN